MSKYFESMSLTRTIQMPLLLSAVIILASCNPEKQEPVLDNTLLKEWTGPYGGVTAFDQINIADVKPAMIQGMEINLKYIDVIANNTD